MDQLKLSWASIFALAIITGTGQTQTVQRLEARIDSILLRWERVEGLRAQRQMEDSLVSLAIPKDTLRAGPFMVIAAASQSALAEHEFRVAWSHYADAVGEELTFEQDIIVFYNRDQPEGRFQISSARRQRFARTSNQRIESGQISEEVYGVIGRILASRIPRRVLNLTGSTRLELEPAPLQQVYRTLASTPSIAVKRCFNGETQLCWESLGISESSDPWQTWYDEEQLRFLVRTSYARPRGGNRRTAFDLCQGGSSTGCRTFVSQLRPRVPLPIEAARSLLALAIQLGGTESYQRLLSDTSTTVKQMFVNAAQVSADSLIVQWLAAVRAAREDPNEGLGRIPLSIIVWSVVMGGIAMRISRWRQD